MDSGLSPNDEEPMAGIRTRLWPAYVGDLRGISAGSPALVAELARFRRDPRPVPVERHLTTHTLVLIPLRDTVIV